MTNVPDDQIDPYEPRLTRRVGAFAEQAVRPIDATAIAAAAAAGARRRTLAGRLFGSMSSTARLGVVLAGAVLATALGAVIVAGGLNGLSPSATSTANGPEATPTSVPGAVDACAPVGLSAGITAWEGAAGHRIATITIHNGGATACALPQYLRPALVDVDGHALIVGQLVPEPAPITFPAGADATTLVDMANYCGAAPTAQLLIRFYLPSEDSFEAGDTTRGRGPLDPPPCNGPTEPGSIQMQPLQLSAAGQ
jgi:uncharacterized protein DUF4232